LKWSLTESDINIGDLTFTGYWNQDMLSILLVSPKTIDLQLPLPPLGLHHLAIALKRSNMEVALYDLSIHDESKMLKEITAGSYDIIGMTVSHVDMKSNLQDLWSYRQAGERSGKKVLFVAGGHSATCDAETWLQTGMIDIVFSGFAEDSLVLFCKMYSFNRALYGEYDGARIALEGLYGVIYLDPNGRLVRIPSQSLTQEAFKKYFYDNVEDIDIPYEDYCVNEDTFGNKLTVVSLYTSSQCQGGCGFCGSQNFMSISQQGFSRTYWLSAEEIFRIMVKRLAKVAHPYILFLDDDFIIGGRCGVERIEELCRLIIESKKSGTLPPDLKLSCQSKTMNFMADGMVNCSVIESMAQAGFFNVGFGIETFSDRLLASIFVNKRNASVSKYRMVLDSFLEFDITPTIYLILGIPDSSVDELVNSMYIALYYMSQGAFVRLSPKMYAYPGSPLMNANVFETVYKSWHHPKAGLIKGVSDYYVPTDRHIYYMVNNLWNAKQTEISRLQCIYPVIDSKKHDYSRPKQLEVCGIMIAVLKLLGCESDINRFDELIYKVLHENA